MSKSADGLQEIDGDLLGFRLTVWRQPHAFDQAILAVVLIGKGVAALQEAGYSPLHPLPGFPRIELLGLYPTMETAAAQMLMIGMLLVGFSANWRASKAAA